MRIKENAWLVILLWLLPVWPALADYEYPPQTVVWTVSGSATETATVISTFTASGTAAFDGYTGTYQSWVAGFTLMGPENVTISRSGSTPNGVNIVPNCSGYGYSVTDGLNWVAAGNYCLLVSGYLGPVTASVTYTNPTTQVFQDSATASGSFNVWYDTTSAVFVSSGTTSYTLLFLRPDGTTVANGTLTNVATSTATDNSNVILSRTGTTAGTLSAVISTQVWVNPPPAVPQAAQADPYNYPNPFRISDGTNFVFTATSQIDQLKISVYSIYQDLIWQTNTGPLSPGVHQIHWDGHDARGRPVFSGMYVAVFDSSQGRQMTRLVGVK